MGNPIAPADVVTLHCIERGKTIPHLSPFVLKLETFLRMAEIEYQIDNKKPYSPETGKMPWITVNGTNVSDSQAIIEFLSQKFDKELWNGASAEEKAAARLTRIALDDHFGWGLIHWRYVKGFDTLADLVQIPSLKFKIGKLIVPRRMRKSLHVQGLGRNQYDVMVKMVSDDLRNISTLLGSKSYWLGEEPSEIDCGVFGFLGQVMWGMPGSPYEKLVKDELTNLESYCQRMRGKFWPDFEKLLVKPKT